MGIDSLSEGVVDNVVEALELGLRGCAGGRDRWRLSGQTETTKDLGDDRFFVDQGDRAHRSMTTRTGQGLDAHGAAQQFGPTNAET